MPRCSRRETSSVTITMLRFVRLSSGLPASSTWAVSRLVSAAAWATTASGVKVFSARVSSQVSTTMAMRSWSTECLSPARILTANRSLQRAGARRTSSFPTPASSTSTMSSEAATAYLQMPHTSRKLRTSTWLISLRGPETQSFLTLPRSRPRPRTSTTSTSPTAGTSV